MQKKLGAAEPKSKAVAKPAQKKPAAVIRPIEVSSEMKPTVQKPFESDTKLTFYILNFSFAGEEPSWYSNSRESSEYSIFVCGIAKHVDGPIEFSDRMLYAFKCSTVTSWKSGVYEENKFI